MKQTVKVQHHKSPTSDQFRIAIPKAAGNAMGFEHGDFLEFSIVAKDTIQYKKVKK